jgi:3-oxoacyl-[acyl-carrier-protein] synthase II
VTARVVVRGIGAVGGFGAGVDAFRRALHEGGVLPGSTPLPMTGEQVDLTAFMADTSPLKDFIPIRTLRRVDHFSRLALLGAHLALADAALPETDRAGLAVVVASGHGATGITFAFQDSFINDGDICASPTHFANSVHNSAAANISILVGATGPSLTVSQFALSVPSALLAARQWLQDGRCTRVLFGAVDELSRLTAHYWHRQHAAPPPGASPRPLESGVETAVPGEGALFMLLSTDPGDAAPGYCTVDEVVVGRSLPAGALRVPAGLVVLGADGVPVTGVRYAEAAAGARIACYTPLYGSMPVSPAFDLAAAALVLREGRVFGSPGADAIDFPATVAGAGEPLDAARAACLTLDDDQGHGLVTLGRL